MSEKLIDAVTIRLSHEDHEALRRLADVDGMGVSELLRTLIDAHMAEKRRQFESLQAAFGSCKTNAV